MRIGVPKEIKNHEYRVGMTPAAVREACHNGHQVLVQTGAGAGIGCEDTDYAQAGVMPTRYSWFLISLGTPIRMRFSRVAPI